MSGHSGEQNCFAKAWQVSELTFYLHVLHDEMLFLG
jgi:hypothetical protein